MTMCGASSLGEPAVFSPEQMALVRRHLEDILASHAFAGTKRTQDFLRLIVTHALHGETDSLRERMIGAEMFGALSAMTPAATRLFVCGRSKHAKNLRNTTASAAR